MTKKSPRKNAQHATMRNLLKMEKQLHEMTVRLTFLDERVGSHWRSIIAQLAAMDERLKAVEEKRNQVSAVPPPPPT